MRLPWDIKSMWTLVCSNGDSWNVARWLKQCTKLICRSVAHEQSVVMAEGIWWLCNPNPCIAERQTECRKLQMELQQIKYWTASKDHEEPFLPRHCPKAQNRIYSCLWRRHNYSCSCSFQQMARACKSFETQNFRTATLSFHKIWKSLVSRICLTSYYIHINGLKI